MKQHCSPLPDREHAFLLLLFNRMNRANGNRVGAFLGVNDWYNWGYLARPIKQDQHKYANPRYQAMTPDERREFNKAQYLLYRERYAEQWRQNSKEWRKNNPDKVREIVRKQNLRRRTRLAGNPVESVDLQAIIARTGGRCHICGRKVRPTQQTFDHLIPVMHGGGFSQGNLALAHRSCNASRGAGRIPAQFPLLP